MTNLRPIKNGSGIVLGLFFPSCVFFDLLFCPFSVQFAAFWRKTEKQKANSRAVEKQRSTKAEKQKSKEAGKQKSKKKCPKRKKIIPKEKNPPLTIIKGMQQCKALQEEPLMKPYS